MKMLASDQSMTPYMTFPLRPPPSTPTPADRDQERHLSLKESSIDAQINRLLRVTRWSWSHERWRCINALSTVCLTNGQRFWILRALDDKTAPHNCGGIYARLPSNDDYNDYDNRAAPNDLNRWVQSLPSQNYNRPRVTRAIIAERDFSSTVETL